MHSELTKARFWSKVAIPDSAGTLGCWLWMGADRNADGYGGFNDGTRVRMAHVFAYECTVGPVPDGLELDHACRCRDCVNPSHLRPMTHRENVLIGDGSAAQFVKRTKCARGHPFSGDNLYHDTKGRRRCRICTNAANQRTREKYKKLRLSTP